MSTKSEPTIRRQMSTFKTRKGRSITFVKTKEIEGDEIIPPTLLKLLDGLVDRVS